MVDFKELGESVSLGGVYTLEHAIRQDGSGSFYAGLNRDGERLLIKLVPEHAAGAEQQFATWQRSRHLRHPHLLDLRDVGRGELWENRYIYGVFEYPDDVLATALEQGPLSEPETYGVLEAALAALRYLHGQGMVHGMVDPAHVVAVGETVKLATDALRESGDLEGHPEDVRQLGELVRSLRAPEPLSEPLATIVLHATAAEARQRWTLAEIARVMESWAAAIPVVPPQPAPAAVVTAAPLVPEPVPPAMPEPAASPDAMPMPALPEHVAVHPRQPEDHAPQAFPKWILAGVAVFLFSILMLNMRSKPETVQAVPLPAPAAPAPDPPRASPPANLPPAPVRPQASPRARLAPASGLWRVIAFTYRTRDNAAKKVQSINSRWPDLRATVFAPKTLRGYYLVALGDGMKKDDAARLQRKARSLGLPRDTFVQNYSE